MEMRVKMGTVVPKMGTVLQLDGIPGNYRAAIALALHAELGSTHRAIKTAMRWTDASERTVKYWFAGERGPSGEHLISLARHSDAIVLVLLALAERWIKDDD
ncbi:MAG: XRE family transcriptional regulator [Paracoccaceae bacterium]